MADLYTPKERLQVVNYLLLSGATRKQLLGYATPEEGTRLTLNDRSLRRAYQYAQKAQRAGDPFDWGRATGHPPPIQHHAEGMKGILGVRLLEDWYIGDCERPPVLADVLRLLNHGPNLAANRVWLAFVGTVETVSGEVIEDFGYSITIERVGLLQALKKNGKNLKELFNFLKPLVESITWRRICQISMRPAVEPPSGPKPKKPTFKLVRPGGKGQKPIVRLVR